jgi:uncharacterized protein YfdQ (DUF2303 family)
MDKRNLTAAAELKSCDATGVPAIAQLAREGVKLKIEDGGIKPFAVIPEHMKVEDLSSFFAAKRIQQSVLLHDADSFTDYVNRFKTAATVIFCAISERGAKYIAVLDYHGEEPKLVAGATEHVATFETITTPEWLVLLEANRKAMSQTVFAEWLEDNLALVVDPASGELLELVTNLVGKSDVRFTSAVRLDSGGSKLNFDEDVALAGVVNTKPGEVKLPKTLTFQTKPFLGAPPYKIQARFKYKIESRKLNLWFELMKPHVIIRECVCEVTKQIHEKTDVLPFLGVATL